MPIILALYPIEMEPKPMAKTTITLYALNCLLPCRWTCWTVSLAALGLAMVMLIERGILLPSYK